MSTDPIDPIDDLFEVCPTALWLEDFTALMARLEALRRSGVTDLRAWIAQHPGFPGEALSLIRVRRVNAAALALHRAADVSELLRLRNVFEPESFDVFADELIALWDGARRYCGETATRTLDGTRLFVRLELSVGGEPPDWSCVVISVQDISERVHAEARLREAQAAQAEAERDARQQQSQKLEGLGVLAGGIAHDFNNLLVSILGNAGLALLKLPSDSPTRDRIEDIETAARQAAELCRQLLAYSGQGHLETHSLDVPRLIREVTDLLVVSMPSNVLLNLDLPETLPAISADPSQIQQVMMNLLTNAAEAIGDDSGVVRVTTRERRLGRSDLDALGAAAEVSGGRFVEIVVAESGCGMDAATRARVFEPFFTTKYAGRGLGLAAVGGIIEAHRGALSVESEPGAGSVFRVLLPVQQFNVAPPPSDSTPETHTPVVLVVDDEDTVRSVTREVLEHFGFQVVEASDGFEAIDIFLTREIDVVVLDLTMPRLNGEETFRELQRIRPDVRVVLASGYSEKRISSQFAGRGIAAFMQKPWSPQVLVERVRAALVP